MADLPHTNPTFYKCEGGILSLSGPALLDFLRAVLSKRVPFRFTARGFSMVPFIKDSDVITVSLCTANEIRFGDIVAFVNPCNERLAVHRVIGISKDAWLIKGDNTPEPDGLIPITGVLGCVTGVQRAGQRIQFGLGIERIIIAFLSRRGWLVSFLNSIRRIYHIIY
jgi:signal peptidase I